MWEDVNRSKEGILQLRLRFPSDIVDDDHNVGSWGISETVSSLSICDGAAYESFCVC